MVLQRFAKQSKTLYRNSIVSPMECRREIGHAEVWLDSIVKSSEFYAKHAEGPVRRYFYTIDLQGRLFLEETRPKNIATSIKSNKFLNFFFSQIEPTRRKEDIDFVLENSIKDDYPYVSRCGKEVNFIRPAATPIVFHSIVGDRLQFGGDLSHKFEHGSLAISTKSGKLYHKLDDSSIKRKSLEALGYGLIRSSVASSLAEHIVHGEDENEGHIFFETTADRQLIRQLPSKFEPGSWAMHE